MSQNTVKCEDCGGVVSRNAQACPHCGKAMQLTSSGYVTAVVVGLAIGTAALAYIALW